MYIDSFYSSMDPSALITGLFGDVSECLSVNCELRMCACLPVKELPYTAMYMGSCISESFDRLSDPTRQDKYK